MKADHEERISEGGDEHVKWPASRKREIGIKISESPLPTLEVRSA